MAAAKKLAKKEQSHTKIEKRLKEYEALSGRTLRRIEEIAYLSAMQKASVNVTSKLKWMQTSAIEFMRAMNSSGMSSAMLINIGRRLRKKQRDNPDVLIAKDKETLAAAKKLAKKEQSYTECVDR